MIDLTFVIKDSTKIEEFEKIFEQLCGENPQIKRDFKPEPFKNNYLIEYNNLKDGDKKEICRSLKINNPALSFWEIKKIFILNNFWERPELQQAIIIHELGHIKYPLTIKDDSFLEKLGGEFLADKYLFEVNKNILKKRFEKWEEEQSQYKLLELLCKLFFILKYYKKIDCDTDLILKIKEIFSELDFDRKVIQDFEELTEIYLKDPNNKKNLDNLDQFFVNKILN